MQFKSMFHGMSYAQINQRMCTFTASNGLQIGWASTKLFKIKVGAGIAEHPVHVAFFQGGIGLVAALVICDLIIVRLSDPSPF